MDLSINHGQMAGRVQAGRSPPPRRRRTREYVPNSQSKRTTKQDYSNLDSNSSERNFSGGLDENMNSVPQHFPSARHRSDSQRSEQLGERYHILKAENKILRERLQNALQREMKALKTFKRLAKENRQLKLNLRKYERTLLGLYEDESGKIIVYICYGTRYLFVIKEQWIYIQRLLLSGIEKILVNCLKMIIKDYQITVSNSEHFFDNLLMMYYKYLDYKKACFLFRSAQELIIFESVFNEKLSFPIYMIKPLTHGALHLLPNINK